MKGLKPALTIVALAVCTFLTLTSCSHDAIEFVDYNAKMNQYIKNWNDSINTEIDPNHDWNTSREAQLTVTANKSGTLRILTRSAFNGDEGRAILYKSTINGGESLRFNIDVPQDLDTLYSALYDSNGYIEEIAFTLEGGKATIAYSQPQSSAFAKVRSVESHNNSSSGWDFTTEFAYGTYATEVPSNATFTTGGGGGPFYIDKETSYNFWSQSTIYIKPGTYNLNKIYIANNSYVYLLPGANVTTSDDGFCRQGGVKVYIAEGASLNMKGISTLNTGAQIFCRGTFTLKDLSLNNSGTIYIGNGGKLNSANIILCNDRSQFICDGSAYIDGNITAAGSSHIYNCGDVEVKQSTILNSYNNTWINEGTWKTNMWEFTAFSTDVVNRCKLTVDNRLTISTSNGSPTFYIDGSASVITKDFLMEKAYIRMGKDALLQITNNAYMNITNPDYGIYGPSEGWAVLQAYYIRKGNKDGGNQDNSKYVTYGGNLTVAADKHFKQEYSGEHPMYYLKDNARMINSQQGATDIYIPASACSPGYGTGTPTTPEPEDPEMWYYYAFEDLGGIGDFDFNDVVLRASAPANGKGDIELCAAGGTLETYIYLGSTALGSGREVHDMFGVSLATMVNTRNRGEKAFIKIGEYTGTSASNLDLSIRVVNKGYSQTITTNNKNGECPLAITINGSSTHGTWKWPFERQRIDNAFPEFHTWVANKDADIDWWGNK